MTPLIDTHAHIYLDHFKDDVNEVLERCADAGVVRTYLPNIDHTSIDDMMELEHKYPNQCFAMMGLHPCSVNKDFEKELYLVEEWLGKRKFVGIGEIGTDLYWDKTYWPEQQEALKIQLEWAKKYRLPAIVHCRDSIDETIQIIEANKDDRLQGIFHCFTGTEKQARKIIDLGFYLGIGGVATFKNGGLDKVLPQIELEHLVLETDSPYLSPVPHRGKRNEPSYVELVANRIAELKQLELDEVKNITTDNANSIFNFKNLN